MLADCCVASAILHGHRAAELLECVTAASIGHFLPVLVQTGKVSRDCQIIRDPWRLCALASKNKSESRSQDSKTAISPILSNPAIANSVLFPRQIAGPAQPADWIPDLQNPKKG